MARMSSDRVASHRARLREQGLLQTTVWLSAENAERIEILVKDRGFKSKSEAVEFALNQAFKKDDRQMTA